MYIDLLTAKNVLGMVECTLRNLPEGLKELDSAYDDVITRIQNQDHDDVAMAKHILTWLYYAARPLTLQELGHSLAVNLVAAVDPDAIELNEDFLPDEEIIISVCAGIVTRHAESNTISFIHYTTKEYFKRRMDRQDVERFLQFEINIADTCLMYLSFKRREFEQFLAARMQRPSTIRALTFQKYADRECPGWDIDIHYPLFRYAARHWGDHVNDMLGQVTKDVFMKFVRQRTSLVASVQVLAEEVYFDHVFPIQISSLCLASFFKLKEIVMMLLEDGQNMEAKNEYNWTALHMATERGHAVIVQLLIDKGANVNAVTKMPGKRDSGATALHWAARNGYEKVLEILLENSAEINLQTEIGETPLYWASDNGQVGAVALLLDKGANLEAKSRHEYTPLHVAALGGEEACVKLLIERGADLSFTTKDGYSLVYLAIRGGAVELVQLLLEKGFDPNSTGGGVLLWAAAGSFAQRRDDVVRLLLEWGADVSIRAENKDETALHRSATFGHDTVARLLLESGAEVDAQNEDGETALHLATKWGFETVVQVLLEKGADVTTKTKAGKTALKLAAGGGHEAIVRHLLNHLGGDLDSEAWLATSQMTKVAFEGDEKAMQLLLDKGADIAAENLAEETALQIAAQKGHVALSRVLLENGANVNALDFVQASPVSRAAGYGHVEVVRLLIEQKANLVAQGHSPLFGAVNSGKVELVRLLLDNGADVLAVQDFTFDTSLHLAVRQGSKLIVKLLLEYGAVVGPRNREGQTALDVSNDYGGGMSSLLLKQ